MRWFKRHKKSRQHSQQPVSLGTPSNIGAVPLGIRVEIDPGAGSEGVLRRVESRNPCGAGLTTAAGAGDGGGSWVVLQDAPEDQRYHPSGTSTPTLSHADDVTRGCTLLPRGWLILTLLAIAPDQERKQNAPSNVLDEHLSHKMPDTFRTEGESKTQDKRTTAKRPAMIPPEHVSGGDFNGEDTQLTPQSEKSKSECRFPRRSLARIHVLQSWKEPGRKRRLRMSQFLLTRRPRVDSVLSEPLYLVFTMITKFVFHLLL